MNKKTVSLSTAIMLMLLVAVIAVIVTTLTTAERFNRRLGNLNDLENKYARLKEVADIVDKYYVGEFEEKTAVDYALAGYVEGLGDRWSGYYTAEQTKMINDRSANSYFGIGATVGATESGEYEIVSVDKNSGAHKAGLAIKDIITAV
ncbi:MAG: hypothetical protein IJS65_05540, partial [Clostridia bacterium]|nr:hypothetical protein [Clostridia bacterium]